jgi:hypothetical protein
MNTRRYHTPLKAAEWDLLLQCARTTVDSGLDHESHMRVAAELDWNYLIETAHHHRVLPLLYRNLLHVDRAAVPAFAIQRLQAAFESNVRRNLFLTRELVRLLDVFAASEIPVIPYKGPILASQLHGDPGLRQFSDLDILVPINDVARTRALLMSQGYRPDIEMTEPQLRAYVRREKDMTLLREDLGIDLEVHWRITAEHDAVRIPPDVLWRQVCPYTFAGRSLQTLTLESLLLVLCVHGARHVWEKLGWLCDIAAITRRPLNWDRVIDEAISLDCERILALGLSLARDLLDAELPARALALIDADPGLPSLSLEVKQHLFSNSTFAPHMGEPARFFLRLRTRRRDRFRIAVNHMRRYAVPTARDEDTLPLPPSLRWVLYLIRPLRLAREYGLAPVRRLWKDLFQL